MPAAPKDNPKGTHSTPERNSNGTPSTHTPELATEKRLSEDFVACIDARNLESSYLLTEGDKVGLLAALVEHESFICPEKIKHLLNYIYEEPQICLPYKWNGNKLDWKLREQSGYGICSLTSRFYNEPFHVAVVRVAKLLGISQDYCFKTCSLDENPAPQGMWDLQYDSSLIPRSLPLKNRLFTLKEIIQVKNISGNPISGLCKYTSEGGSMLFLPASVEQIDRQPGNMSIGHTPAHAYLLNRDIINQHPNALVVWPMNLQVSLALNELVDESKTILEEELAITGHYGGVDASLYAIVDDLWGHEVILIPELARQSMKTVLGLANNCMRAGAQSVRIYPYPLCLYTTSMDADKIEALSDPWEREMLQNAKILPDIELPSKLLMEIKEKSMTPEKYIAWGKDKGLFKGENCDPAAVQNAGEMIESVYIVPQEESQTSAYAPIKALCCLDEIITVEARTLIWAPSNAGKSLFILYLAVSLAYGINMFVFSARKPRKIAIFDAETGITTWDNRVRAIDGCYPIQENCMENLYRMRKKGNPAYSTLNLFSADWQNNLLHLWKEHGIEVVVFDNLISLCGTAANSAGKLDEFFKFVSQIETQGIAVILVHHSNKDERKMKGVYELQAKCQNVIRLEGKKQLLPEEDPFLALQQALDIDGAVIRMTVEECKDASDMEGKSHFFHLPIGHGHWIALSEDTVLPLAPLVESPEGSIEALQDSESTVANLETLSKKAKKVYEYIQGKPSVMRKDIDEHTGWNEKTVLKYINELLDARLIDRPASGSTTYYQAR